ncbi:helix-hairpin-helix domain-containing protein [Peribacillus sp. NPDC096379]|uniref:helix-hairpin-helix domain-containing protein n=1 Tax=Peribacillus sp. NPDC096379 TaxID=3364393 RepID=UPI0037F6CB44
MDVQGKKKIIIGIVAGIALLLVFAYFQTSKPEPKETAAVFSDGGGMFDEPLEQEEEEQEEVIIKVDVKGAVNRPGVYIADSGDRVIDLIADAGDFTSEANKDQVNLAQVVEDQMVILVPEIGDESVDGVITGPETSLGGSSDGKINLNTATQAELETLTGVGPSKALSIIDYREKTGKFQSVEDLKKISGIGDKTFEKLKDSIKVK